MYTHSPHRISKYNSHFLFSGGALISTLYVLTAAHVVTVDPPINIISIQLVLGAHNITDSSEPNRLEVLVGPDSIIRHESFNPSDGLKNDIALIKMYVGVTLVPGAIETIPIATGTQTYSFYSAIVSGWGVDNSGSSSDVLKQVSGAVMPNLVCSFAIGLTIPSSQLCVDRGGSKGNGICFGDSGGPLTAVVNNNLKLIGVAR